MGKLPVVSGDDVRKALELTGCMFQRLSGSHMALTKSGSILTLAVPRHRELPAGTRRKILSDTGLSVDALTSLLD